MTTLLICQDDASLDSPRVFRELARVLHSLAGVLWTPEKPLSCVAGGLGRILLEEPGVDFRGPIPPYPERERP